MDFPLFTGPPGHVVATATGTATATATGVRTGPDIPQGRAARKQTLERTLSTHHDLDEAIEALHAAVAANTRTLEQRGERGTALALAVLDPAGATVMCMWAGAAGATRYQFTDPDSPQPYTFPPQGSQPG